MAEHPIARLRGDACDQVAQGEERSEQRATGKILSLVVGDEGRNANGRNSHGPAPKPAVEAQDSFGNDLGLVGLGREDGPDSLVCRLQEQSQFAEEVGHQQVLADELSLTQPGHQHRIKGVDQQCPELEAHQA